MAKRSRDLGTRYSAAVQVYELEAQSRRALHFSPDEPRFDHVAQCVREKGNIPVE
jgi:hypothetical protein